MGEGGVANGHVYHLFIGQSKTAFSLQRLRVIFNVQNKHFPLFNYVFNIKIISVESRTFLFTPK